MVIVVVVSVVILVVVVVKLALEQSSVRCKLQSMLRYLQLSLYKMKYRCRIYSFFVCCLSS